MPLVLLLRVSAGGRNFRTVLQQILGSPAHEALAMSGADDYPTSNVELSNRTKAPADESPLI
jgi:hypothetical protein